MRGEIGEERRGRGRGEEMGKDYLIREKREERQEERTKGNKRERDTDAPGKRCACDREGQ